MLAALRLWAQMQPQCDPERVVWRPSRPQSVQQRNLVLPAARHPKSRADVWDRWLEVGHGAVHAELVPGPAPTGNTGAYHNTRPQGNLTTTRPPSRLTPTHPQINAVTVCHSMPLYATLCRSMQLYASPYQSTPLYTTLRHYMPLYTTLYHSMPFYAALHQSIPLYAALHQSIPLDATAHATLPTRLRRWACPYLARSPLATSVSTGASPHPSLGF